jgi:4-alpha-glucanotransferase
MLQSQQTGDNLMKARGSGILLHVSSLPSPYGVGDLGRGAYLFVDFLSKAKQSYWQVLPLNPTSAFCGNSPYCGYSAFAANPLFIAPDLLVRDGFLHESDLAREISFDSRRVSYEAILPCKFELLRRSWERSRGKVEGSFQFGQFCTDNAQWLEDFALFVALKERFGGVAWNEWPEEIRNRRGQALVEWRERLKERVLEEKYYQYLFAGQWLSLKKHCNSLGIQIIGDIPIYVSFDSADVWANPEIFKLDEHKMPQFIAGVPPDYFSPTGQRWGNPVYHWDKLKEMRYGWWIKRMEHNLLLFDIVRLDHFRGFAGYWEIPASETTAVNGKWRRGPGRDFFDGLFRRFPFLPVIAEDLGVITPDVREIMTTYGFPGMKVLQFAFGDDLPQSPYALHNHSLENVVYTGTHDNNTARGWFAKDAGEKEKERLFKYIGHRVDETRIHWEFIRLAMMSVARTAVFPMQDVLGLGEEARMNHPSITYGNWEWRLVPDQLAPEVAEELAEMACFYGRTS